MQVETYPARIKQKPEVNITSGSKVTALFPRIPGPPTDASAWRPLPSLLHRSPGGGGIGKRAGDPRGKSCNFVDRRDIDLWFVLFEPDMSLHASL